MLLSVTFMRRVRSRRSPKSGCLPGVQRVVKTQAKANTWYGPDRPKWLGETRVAMMQ